MPSVSTLMTLTNWPHSSSCSGHLQLRWPYLGGKSTQNHNPSCILPTCATSGSSLTVWTRTLNSCDPWISQIWHRTGNASKSLMPWQLLQALSRELGSFAHASSASEKHKPLPCRPTSALPPNLYLKHLYTLRNLWCLLEWSKLTLKSICSSGPRRCSHTPLTTENWHLSSLVT